MKKLFHHASLLASSALALALLAPAVGAEDAPARAAAPDRDAMVAAAREIIAGQTYCALVTVDEAGLPHVRTMNPFPPEADMSVWMATSTKSRKVQQIRKNPRVVLYYADHGKATGSVALSGRAELVEDMAEVLKRKRAYWDQSFPGLKNIVLIKVVPERLEVLNYKAGLNGDPVSFQTPGIDLVPAAARP